MKIINEFSKEELEFLDKEELKITNKEYSYDEITFIENTMEYFLNVKIAKTILKKIKEIKKRYPEFFDFYKWKKDKSIKVSELQSKINSYDILNKKIVSILPTGNDSFMTKHYMVNLYNNSEELMKNKDWWYKKKITKEYIPDTIEKAAIYFMKTPIVIKFEDGSTFEIIIKNYSEVYTAINQLAPIDKKYDTDLNYLCEEVINQKIKDIKVETMKKDSFNYTMIKPTIKNDENIWYIALTMENEYEIRLYVNELVLFYKNEPKLITMKEYKKIYKHYDWLFWHNVEERKSQSTVTKTLSKLQKDLVSELKKTKLSKGGFVPIIIALKTKKQQSEMMNYLVEESKKGNLSKLEEQDLIGKMLEIIEV